MTSGTKKKPVVARVPDLELADMIFALAREHGVRVTVRVDPTQPMDIEELDAVIARRSARAEASSA